MEMLNRNTRKKVIDDGEERLHVVYSPKASSREADLVIGYDGGSTQGRCIIIDIEAENPMAEMETTYVAPSVSSFVPDDRTITPKSGELFDNMDSYIANTSGKMDALVQTLRVIRGQKMVDESLAENRLSSSDLKTTDPVFYANIVDGIGYALIQKYGDAVPHKVNIFLGVALPPDDKGEISQNRLRENLNKFSWTHRPSNTKLEMSINVVSVMTEPEAFVKAHYARLGEEIPDHCLHIEGGGRSTGVEILRNGVSLDAAQRSLSYGGSQLLDNIAQMYVNKYGGARPTRRVMEIAIRKGYIQSGNSQVDIVEMIKQAKEDYAKQIVNDVVQQVFDQQQQVRLLDVNIITVSGRLMAAGDYGISMAPFVEAEFKKRSPHTDFSHLSENLIPFGLTIEAYMEYMDRVEANSANNELQGDTTALEQVAASAETNAPVANANDVNKPQ